MRIHLKWPLTGFLSCFLETNSISYSQYILSLVKIFFYNRPIISRLKCPALSLKLRRAIQSFLGESGTLNQDNKQIIQQWDKFSLEVVGDKLRQTLASCISTNTSSNIGDKASNDDNVVGKTGDSNCDLVVRTFTGSAAFLKVWCF